MKNSLVNRVSSFHPVPHSIDELFLGCLLQDPKTQRELFERLYSKMYSICLKYIKETAAAEDVLIIAFDKIFKRIAQFSQKASFEAWIRRIIINECLMHLEKQKAKFREINVEQLSGQMIITAPDDALDWEDMIRTLQKLPKGYRTVFELFVLKGMSHEEISNQLQISENTSKSQLSRARVQLQKLLNLNDRKN